VRGKARRSAGELMVDRIVMGGVDLWNMLLIL
jgi:hypothetical protein